MRRSIALYRTIPFLTAWGFSLILPAVELDLGGGAQRMRGWMVLASGYYALAAYQFGWLADVALWGVLVGLSSIGMQRRWLVGWSVLLLLTTVDAFELFLRPDYWGFKGAGPGFWLWTTTNLDTATTGFMVATRQGKLPR